MKFLGSEEQKDRSKAWLEGRCFCFDLLLNIRNKAGRLIKRKVIRLKDKAHVNKLFISKPYNLIES